MDFYGFSCQIKLYNAKTVLSQVKKPTQFENLMMSILMLLPKSIYNGDLSSVSIFEAW